MNQTSATPVSRSFIRQWDLLVVALALIYFIGRAVYYALNIAPNFPPDEAAHFGISQIFAKTFWLPTDSADSYRFGLITRSPSLYYYLMGRATDFNVLLESDLRWLRLVNVALGVGTVVFGNLWMRLFTTNRIARSLFVVMVTNIPMFTFLCASVSYDNLTNLFAAMSVYLLTLFFVQRRPEPLCGFFAAILLGPLTKYTFLPLSAILLFILVVHERRLLLHIPRQVVRSLRPLTLRRLALVTTVIGLLVVSVCLFGGNLVRYHRVVPNPRQVLSLDQCMQSPIFARDYIAQEFRQGRMTLEEAFRAAGRINDEGTKVALAAMLTEAMRNIPAESPSGSKERPTNETGDSERNKTSWANPLNRPLATIAAVGTQALLAAEATKSTPERQGATAKTSATTQQPTSPLLSPGRYLQFWVGQMFRTTFGILAQMGMLKMGIDVQVYAALFACAAVVFVFSMVIPAWKPRYDYGLGISIVAVAAIVAIYAVALLWVNYQSYTATGMAALAVQGRYLFPVLVPAYGLVACLLVCELPRHVPVLSRWLGLLQSVVAILIGSWFVYGDLPFFLANATPHWFG